MAAPEPPRELLTVRFRAMPALLLLLAAGRAGATDLAPWRSTTPEVRRFTLRLARRAFDTFALTRRRIPAPRGLPPLLATRAAVFVSTMRFGAPRCCMGTIQPTEPTAAEEIISLACAAAANDLRFKPLKPAELKGVTLIVSMVGAPTSISEADALRLDPVSEGLVARAGEGVGVTLSGETTDPATMVRWARIRARARPRQRVQYSRLDVVRWKEGSDDGL